MMAMAFHTTLPIILGEGGIKSRKPEARYEVGSGRLDNSMAVYVYDNENRSHKFYKSISLQWHWWRSSPAERIRKTIDKATRIADKLNHQELFLQHEAEISERLS